MSLTQFAMVEELASLIRDNFPCKYLVLSVEEALVNFLQDDTSSNGILELEPMNSYNRLLMHRLADIFGFSHHSVGEGDDRHLVLERCTETYIPSILVSDLLWQYDELKSPKILEVAKRKEDSPEAGLKEEKPNFEMSLEEREAAYLAARQRIFSVDEYETGKPVKQRPHNNPIVAQRMIAHALGQRIRPSSQEVSQSDVKELQDPDNTPKIQEAEGAAAVGTQTFPKRNDMTGKHLKSCNKEKASMLSCSSSPHSQTKTSLENVDTPARPLPTSKEGGETNIQKENFRQEHMGAAKRMFAHALGFHPRNAGLPKSSQSK